MSSSTPWGMTEKRWALAAANAAAVPPWRESAKYLDGVTRTCHPLSTRLTSRGMLYSTPSMTAWVIFLAMVIVVVLHCVVAVPWIVAINLPFLLDVWILCRVFAVR